MTGVTLIGISPPGRLRLTWTPATSGTRATQYRVVLQRRDPAGHWQPVRIVTVSAAQAQALVWEEPAGNYRVVIVASGPAGASSAVVSAVVRLT